MRNHRVRLSNVPRDYSIRIKEDKKSLFLFHRLSNEVEQVVIFIQTHYGHLTQLSRLQNASSYIKSGQIIQEVIKLLGQL